MDVKSAFLNGKLDEEVSVEQPLGFEDLAKPHHIYVDDISFGSSSRKLCTKFISLMSSHFGMSMMGELTFFLGLQICQLPNGIFINLEKYIRDMLAKFDMSNITLKPTPMSPPNNLHADPEGKHVNPTHYRGMIGSLMYLTTSRPDIMFATCLCARYQASPRESHLLVVKRIFKYLKGTSILGLGIP
uniref:uncharacterized mitochondrial protein AtMg00810-like n=1 Tax=Erigeron canadensis TaxID=72917 RepID=UPI001CB99A38|nr:uncharacterized mitochondrial protein AtMg00810-like [Erigeron canadensis]